MPIVWMRACGLNDNGQLGDGTTIDRASPIIAQVSDLIKSAAGSSYHSLVVLEDGTVWAWGLNNFGQLGDGTTTNSLTPVQVKSVDGVGFLQDIIAVAAAAGSNAGTTSYRIKGSFSLALKKDGTVLAWGANSRGQLGDGTTTPRSTPVQVLNLTNIIAIAAGGSSVGANDESSGFALALRNDGTVWAWGDGSQGQLGNGSTGNSSTPVQVRGPEGVGYLTGIVAIAAGSSDNESYSVQKTGHALALKSDGTVWAWGYNGTGQLGDGTTTDRTTPVQVQGISDVEKIAAGGSHIRLEESLSYLRGGHSLALKKDGTVWAWGLNNFGQLGDGTTTNRTTPVQVQELSNVVDIACGAFHSIAVKSDGTIWAWGRNHKGQLGDGTTTDRLTPVRVGTLRSGIVAVSTKGHNSLFPQGSKALLFADLNDDPMVTVDLGQVLADNTLGPTPIRLYNAVGTSVSGVKVTRYTLPPDDTVEISATKDLFVHEDPLPLSGIFQHDELIGTVWVRIKPPILVDGQPNQGLKQFVLRATNAAI